MGTGPLDALYVRDPHPDGRAPGRQAPFLPSDAGSGRLSIRHPVSTRNHVRVKRAAIRAPSAERFPLARFCWPGVSATRSSRPVPVSSFQPLWNCASSGHAAAGEGHVADGPRRLVGHLDGAAVHQGG